MIKVKDAEKLICPFIQQSGVAYGANVYGKTTNINCITNKCMSWKLSKVDLIHYDKEKPNKNCKEFLDEALQNCWIERLEDIHQFGVCLRLESGIHE